MRVLAGGDVFANAPDVRAAFRHLTPLLRTADVVFANCEGVYSDRAKLAPSRKHAMCAPRRCGEVLKEVPFHVMTCANNHIVDGGYEGLADTLELLRDQGILVTGAGADIAEARVPAIVARGGMRVAFVGVCSVFPKGYEASPRRAGLAPLRLYTHYADADPAFWEPGASPRTFTVPLVEDIEGLRQSIAEARHSADYVVVAFHWGVSSRDSTLEAYEVALARQAVEMGADAVVCHHHHSLRGVAIYRGRPIFFGLGALVHHFDPRSFSDREIAARRSRMGIEAFEEAMQFPLFPMPSDARMTGLAVLDFSGLGEGVSASFVPAQILADGSTTPLRSDDTRAHDVADHLELMSRRAGFATVFRRDLTEEWMLLRIESA